MAVFLGFTMVAYIYLVWSWSRDFGQHHWAGRLRRRWTRGSAFFSLVGLVLVLLGGTVLTVFGALGTHEVWAIPFFFLFGTGMLSCLLVAPSIFAFSSVFRVLEFMVDPNQGQPGEEGMGLNTEGTVPGKNLVAEALRP